jgi:hypothetical protein
MAARAHTRRPSAKLHAPHPPQGRAPAELASFTEQWWTSWRRANALGWDYLDAMTGLMRLNLDAFSRASRFTPFARS